MPNILNFLKLNGNTSFEKLPFCEADLIVLGLLSYANFEDSVISKHNDCENSFVNVKKYHSATTSKKITNHFLLPKPFLYFLDKFMKCKRYNHLEIGYFKEKKDDKIEVQFFGLTFKVDNKYFVTFRGTDRSVVGWKEDFNLVLVDEIPSQNDALKYLKDMINILNDDVYVLGHSKGGNLAYYSFYFLDDELKNKVKKVYNLDGPGFRFDTSYYSNKYKDKLIKIVPADDVVGVLLDDPSEFTICASSKSNVSAHDMMTWQFATKNKYCELKKVKELTIYSEALRQSLNNFIEKIGLEKVEFIKEYIFGIISINKVTDVISITQNILLSAYRTFRTYKKSDPEGAAKIEQLLKIFIKEYTSSLKRIEESRRVNVFNLLKNKNKKEGKIL